MVSNLRELLSGGEFALPTVCLSLFEVHHYTVMVMVVYGSTRGTRGPRLWHMQLFDTTMLRRYAGGIRTERL